MGRGREPGFQKLQEWRQGHGQHKWAAPSLSSWSGRDVGPLGEGEDRVTAGGSPELQQEILVPTQPCMGWPWDLPFRAPILNIARESHFLVPIAGSACMWQWLGQGISIQLSSAKVGRVWGRGWGCSPQFLSSRPLGQSLMPSQAGTQSPFTEQRNSPGQAGDTQGAGVTGRAP